MVLDKPKKNSGKKIAKKSTRAKKRSEKNAWFISLDSRNALKERFKDLKDQVQLDVFTRKGENDPYNTVSVQFCLDLSRLSNKIRTKVHSIGDESSKRYDVEYSPTILFEPEKYNIRFTGAPIGEEGRSFIETILMVSSSESGLSKRSKKALAALDEKRDVMVFVSPDCPYCPGQVINAFRAAVERPDLIRAECVESTENMDLAKVYDVGGVPHTVVNHTTLSRGLQPEEIFIRELVTMEHLELEPTQPAEDLDIEGFEEPDRDVRRRVEDQIPDDKVAEVDLIILGGGPAGLTAGIYAQRSGLKSIVLEKSIIGGLVALTPVVENYPGFTNIAGKKLMDLIATQARNYVQIHEDEDVIEIKVGKKIEAYTNRRTYRGLALIIATGAGYKKLNVPGEEKYSGRGVSYCATCDGYFFKGKNVVLVGGGNSAMTDALYLNNLGADVTIIHRRDKLRAQKYLQDSIEREKIPVIWNTVVEEIFGKDKLITGVRVRDVKTKKIKHLKTEGVFIAIGEDPNSKLAGEIGITLGDGRFINVDRGCRTNIPRIYAAGDVTGGVRQIVTAVSEGATAALSAFSDIANPYWLK